MHHRGRAFIPRASFFCNWHKLCVFFIANFLCLFFSTSSSSAKELTPSQQAQLIFQRIAGVPLMSEDPRLAEMEMLISTGKFEDAAYLATDDRYFYGSTLARFASVMSERDEAPDGIFNDFQAMILGVARDNIDARELLTANYSYEDKQITQRQTVAGGESYTGLAEDMISCKDRLEKRVPQWDDNSGVRISEMNVAGLLSTRRWGASHYDGGTNRRALERTFKIFLCAPIESWRNITIEDKYVRRDVDRSPSGNPLTYKTECRGCHAPMDGMGGAFARFDFVAPRLTYSGSNRIPTKMTRNSSTFPDGYATVNEHWINYLADPTYDTGRFGWHGQNSGMGLKSFGNMIANSDAFRGCLTQRVYKEVCRREPGTNDKPILNQISDRFAAKGYKIRSLFADVAANAECLIESRR